MKCPHCGKKEEVFLKGKYFCVNCGLEKNNLEIEKKVVKKEVLEENIEKKKPEEKVGSELSGVFSQISKQFNIPQEKPKKTINNVEKIPFKVKVQKKKEKAEKLSESSYKKPVKKKSSINKRVNKLIKTPELKSSIIPSKEIEKAGADIKKEKQEVDKLEAAEKILDILEHNKIKKEISKKPLEKKKIVKDDEIKSKPKEHKEVESESLKPKKEKVPESTVEEIKLKPKEASTTTILKPKKKKILKKKPKKSLKKSIKEETEITKIPTEELKIPTKSTPIESTKEIFASTSDEEDVKPDEIQTSSEVFDNDYTKGWLEQDMKTKDIKEAETGKEENSQKSPINIMEDINITESPKQEVGDKDSVAEWLEEKPEEKEDKEKGKKITVKKSNKKEAVTGWFKSFEKELNISKGKKKKKAKKRNKKKKRSFKKLIVILFIIFLAFIIIPSIGFYIYFNISDPEVGLNKAESALDFTIKQPQYLPPGYELSTPVIINREKTSLVLTYKYLPDETKKITFIQTINNWDNEDLYNNYVITNAGQYSQKESDGKVIYTMNSKKATWVFDNLWFVLEVNADNITSEELVKIASSVK